LNPLEKMTSVINSPLKRLNKWPTPLFSPMTSSILLGFTSEFAKVHFGILLVIFSVVTCQETHSEYNLPTIWRPGHRPWPMPLWLHPWVLCYYATPLCLLSIKVHLPNSTPKQLPVGPQKSFIIRFYIIRMYNTGMRLQHYIIYYYCLVL
jgi:hypothetical protein